MKKSGSASELARRLGIHKTSVIERIKRGTIAAKKQGRGYIIEDMEQAVETYEATKMDRGDKTQAAEGEEQNDTFKLTAARARKEKAVADMKEMEAMQRRGELVEVRAIRKEAADLAIRVRDALLNIPQRIAPELAGETDAHACELIVDKEIRDAIKRLTDGNKTKDG